MLDFKCVCSPVEMAREKNMENNFHFFLLSSDFSSSHLPHNYFDDDELDNFPFFSASAACRARTFQFQEIPFLSQTQQDR